jgi:uncharacterized protein (TIGR03437 family)
VVYLRLLLVGFLGIGVAQVSSPTLAIRVPNLTVPAGGVAQIQVYSGSPVTLVSGELLLDLDPIVFGAITAADVFSATGDQVGAANIQDRHVDVRFRSLTGGVGRLPGLPILTVTVPVLSTAAAGAVSTITVKSGTSQSSPWKDIQNVQYSVTNGSGTLTVGGSLSVGSVTPGGGVLPVGSVVRIGGTGFTAATKVTVDGVALARVQFVSSQEIDITLAAPADLSGRRVVVQNADGAQVAFFSALRGSYVERPSSGALATIQPIFPQQLYLAAEPGNFTLSNAAIALRNSSLQAVDVAVKAITTAPSSSFVTGSTITLPPGGIYVVPGFQVTGSSFRTRAVVVPTSPIQMALIDPMNGGSTVTATPVPVVQPYAIGASSEALYGYYGAPLTWNWAIGSALPAPVTLSIVMFDLPAPFTVSVQSDGSWLSLSPAQGTTCSYSLSPTVPNCPASSKVTLTADPSKLAPGAYNATLTITPQVFGGKPTLAPVILNVSATPLLFVDRNTNDFGAWTPDRGPQSTTVSLTSNAGSTPFSVTTTTQSGQNWLTVSPNTGSTPATLTITANPAALPAPGDTGTVTVTGPSNKLTIAVAMQIATPGLQTFDLRPSSLLFSVGAGQAVPAPLTVNVQPGGLALSPLTVTAQTSAGGNWLSASVRSPGDPNVLVSVDQAGLAPGTYHGTVTISSSLAVAPGSVPVTLVVWATPPPVTVSPATLSFAAVVGSAAPSQTINIATGDTPMYYNIGASTSDGGTWLSVSTAIAPLLFLEDPTPTTATVYANATTLAPGVYHGTLTITAPANSANSATVAVTLTVAPWPGPLPQQGTVPLAAAVLNSASQEAGGVSPGEIVTIFGQNIGPSIPAGFAVGADGKAATTIGGVQALFDGIPAPLLYASATQVNAIVPYEVARNAVTNLQLQFNGTAIPAGGIAVVPAAPAVFALDSTGQGAAAVLNPDNSINSPANPAARGSVVQIYATGEGATSPDGITGEITGTDTKRPVLPVSVTIGGVTATILYAASAPDAVSGLFQVNAVVPQSVAPGPAVPLVLTVGTASGPSSVTIAVK